MRRKMAFQVMTIAFGSYDGSHGWSLRPSKDSPSQCPDTGLGADLRHYGLIGTYSTKEPSAQFGVYAHEARAILRPAEVPAE